MFDDVTTQRRSDMLLIHIHAVTTHQQYFTQVTALLKYRSIIPAELQVFWDTTTPRNTVKYSKLLG